MLRLRRPSDLHLSYRVEELERLLGIDQGYENDIRIALKVSPTTARLIGFLSKRKYAAPKEIYTMLYGGRPECDMPEQKNVYQFILRARRALRPRGIDIRCSGWEHYSMSSQDKEKLKMICG